MEREKLKTSPLVKSLGGLALALAAFSGVVEGQEPAKPSSPPWLWKARLPGGEYAVRLDAIRSVSLHHYVVEGVAKVAEVNIATDSSALARFYYLEPHVPEGAGSTGQSMVELAREKWREAIERAGASSTEVIKSYPAATHAHTIEFRLSSRADLEKLFQSIERAWAAGQGSELSL